MRKLVFLAAILVCMSLAPLAIAQQGDASIGFGTVLSPGAASCSTDLAGLPYCPEKGGLYPTVGGDVIFHRRFGVGFDATWRGGQGNYGGADIPYRPLIFDFNGVYQPRLGKKVGLDLVGGIGWQSTRFYGFTPTFSCEALNACYNSSNHFLVDVGAGVRYYVWGHVFVRPEVRYYHIMNNTADFTGNNVFRVGASIGYTIAPE